MRRFDENLIEAFVTLPTGAAIMKEAGISKTRYYRLLKDPDFQQVVRERRAEISEGAVRRMEGYLLRDVEILQGIIENSEISPQTRTNAVSVMLTQYSSWKQNVDFERRLLDLERAKNNET